MSVNQPLASAVSTGKCMIGARSSIDAIKNGDAKLVVIARNCSQEEREDIERFAELAQIPIHIFDGTSWDMGETVGKPFMVSAIAVIEAGDSKILKMF
ncbi:MAG: 50S ribosomal protein L30e [Candidatus Thorarchaeota archaeon]|nr:MAG: 50S ribosomal protein L30e [Candidatus Thorarchaeota archaeon]